MSTIDMYMDNAELRVRAMTRRKAAWHTCPDCEGTGAIPYTHPNDPDPRFYACEECDGDGLVPTIEEDDL